MAINATGIDVIARTTAAGQYTLNVTPPTGAAQTVTMEGTSIPGVQHWGTTFNPGKSLGRAPTPADAAVPAWTIKIKKQGAANYRSLTPADLQDLIVVVGYQVS